MTTTATGPIVQRAWEQLESHVRDLPMDGTRRIDDIEKWGYPDWVFRAQEPLCTDAGYMCTFTLQNDRYKESKRIEDEINTACQDQLLKCNQENAQTLQLYEAWRKEHDSRWFFQSVSDLGPQPRVYDCSFQRYQCLTRGPRGYMNSFVVVRRNLGSAE